ncbi:carbohydrate ABC transporter permease [Phytoactinopolyspora halotolerans]|uniref:Sugar ABC transporter permease n=1 Tax=Phytoactinopolyspora halotolerans TaxID=1981512 RepID=A0A6L9S2B2_9ACTN|nr:sugar ABC transporter permease [Phytoactinopolyspora halotolerans]NED98567.1 sugar ABC transporter permease [Phytoactinopolyspora halotolerans]
MSITDSTRARASTSDQATPSLSHRRRQRRRAPGEAVAGYLFLSPWLAGLLFLTIGPMVASLYLSFTDYDLLTAPRWVGFDNFAQLFSDPRWIASVGVTLTYVLFSVPGVLIVSLAVALALNKGFRLLSAYRAAYYLPSLLGSSVAIAILWRQVFGDQGAVNAVLDRIGIHMGSWIGSPDTALYTLIVLNIWTFGATMIIFLAGLRQIPTEYYQAAAVDGAGKIRQFRSITLPMLTPLIFFNILLTTVNAFQAFTPAYVISEGTGGPANSTLFYTLYLYEQGFTRLEMGYASAMAWVLVVALGIGTALLFASARYWVFYGDER